MNVPDGLVEQLRSWKRVVVIGHVTPDADCLASMLAIAQCFAGDGQREIAIALPPGSVSQRIGFMIEWVRPQIAGPDAFARADGFVAVDTAKAPRCNVDASVPETWADGKPVINIDHHASNTRFGTTNWVEERASSTSQLVYVLLRAAGANIPPEVCSLLYAGIITDTVGFTLATVSPEALRTAADLVANGADVDEIGRRMYRSQTPSEFQLMRTVFANTHLTADNQIAYSTADHEEITGAGCTAADVDEQVSVPRSVRDIKMALLLSEGVPGKTRINFRGESGTNVLELAKSFGGGGHAEAAGAILDMSLHEAVPLVVSKATEYLRQRTRENES